MSTKSKKRVMTVSVSEKLLEEFKEEVKRQNKFISGAVEEALLMWLKEKSQNK